MPFFSFFLRRPHRHHHHLNPFNLSTTKKQLWRLVSKTVLSPSHPFHAHRLLHEACYTGWDASQQGPPPLWNPDRDSEASFRDTNLARLMAGLSDPERGRKAAFAASPEAEAALVSAEWNARATGDPSKDYDLLHRVSVSEPEFFWPRVFAEMRVDFAAGPPLAALEISPSANADPDSVVWLPGARINVAAAALSAKSHDDDSPALVAADEASPTLIRTVRRRELRAAANTAAAAFLCSGLQPGDRVAVVGSLTPALTAVYLGAVLAGLVPVAVAESFSAAEVSTRLRLSGASAVWAADAVTRGGKALPLLPRVVDAAASAAAGRKGKSYSLPLRVFVGSSSSLGVFGPLCGDSASARLHPSATEAISKHADNPGMLIRRWADVVACLPPGSDLSFVPFVAASEATQAASQTPMTLLFSSGTTGEPKAIPWSHVTPLRCAVDCFANLDLRRGDVLCWPTSLGWMMGAFSIFGSLLNGAALALFDGTPLGKAFGEFVSAARVTQLGVVPSMVRAWRAAKWLEKEQEEGGDLSSSSSSKENPTLKKTSCSSIPDWGSLRVMASTGEASAPEDYSWLSSRARYVPVLEFCGGTEVGSAYASGTLLQSWSPSTFTTPTLGCSFVLLIPNSDSSSSSNDSSSSDDDLHLARQSPHGSTEPCSGELALVPPILGSSQALFVLDDEEEGRRRHRKTYFEGMPRLFKSSSSTVLRRHGDAFARLPCSSGGSSSCYAALGRTDDAMNLGGVKVASAEVERVVVAALGTAKNAPSSSSSSTSAPASDLPLISEVAAVGVPAPGGGPDSLVLVVVPSTAGGTAESSSSSSSSPSSLSSFSSSSSSALESSLRAAAAAAIRRDLSPLFRVERVVLRSSLPRTATGKIMRRTLRDELRVGAKL